MHSACWFNTVSQHYSTLCCLSSNKSSNRWWKWTIVLECPTLSLKSPLLSPSPIPPPLLGLWPVRSVHADDAWCSGTSDTHFIRNGRKDGHPRHGPKRHPLCSPRLQPQPWCEFLSPPPTPPSYKGQVACNWHTDVNIYQTNPSMWALCVDKLDYQGMKLIVRIWKADIWWSLGNIFQNNYF